MITFADVQYKIVGFNSDNGHISVLYDGLDIISTLELHLTPMGLYPEGEELDTFIRMMCPIHIINRKTALTNGVPNSDFITSLVEEAPAHIVLPPSKPLPF